MKLSEVNQRKADLEAIAELRDSRRDIARLLATIANETTAIVGDGYHEITVTGDAVAHVRRALEHAQLDVDQELIGLGVEIDEPADAYDFDGSDDGDDEAAVEAEAA